MALYLDLIRSRDLFRNLFRRDFQAKYRGSVLGVIWSLVNPVVLMLVYFFVFGVVQHNTTPHFAVYLLSGIALWMFFNLSVQVAARSMIDSAALIRKVRFPRQLVAFSSVATQAVAFVAMIVIVIVVSFALVPSARDTVWLLIPIAVLFLGIVVGCSLTVACLNVLLRDYEYVQQAMLLPWFFLAPIVWVPWFWTAGSVESHSHRLIVDGLLWFDFVAPPIQAVHYAAWLGAVPPPSIWLYLVGDAVVWLAIGAFVFKRVDNRIAIEV
jgi:ABC-type polysaccharide/polyol phosphate export permease